jgi:hypothetical protein
MPQLTSEALQNDPEGLAFLADVLRSAPSAPLAGESPAQPQARPRRTRKPPPSAPGPCSSTRRYSPLIPE